MSGGEIERSRSILARDGVDLDAAMDATLRVKRAVDGLCPADAAAAILLTAWNGLASQMSPEAFGRLAQRLAEATDWTAGPIQTAVIAATRASCRTPGGPR